jgi:hypothetical protein
MPTAITEVIKSLNQAEAMFGLRRSLTPDFFAEWQSNLPPLTPGEEAALDRIKTSYLHNSADGPLSESTINLLLVSPLLYLSGLCDPPFKLRGEAPVDVRVEEGEQTLSGRIDALTLQERFWWVLAEPEQAKLSFSMAIPQALAYMTAGPNGSEPLFGLVTNGDGFLFIKLVQQPQPTYGFSDDFSLFRQSRNDLYSVLKILKRIGQMVR